MGAPIDSGISHRSGARFGPQAIRGGDYLPHDGQRPYLALRTGGLKDLKVFDAVDLLMAVYWYWPKLDSIRTGALRKQGPFQLSDSILN